MAFSQNKATYAGDDMRTGWYNNQPLLSPSNVGSPSFGKIFDTPINGQVYGQPLVSNNILFVATEQNWIYGLDPLVGTLKWSRNVGQPWNIADIGCSDLAPTIGVTGTPVIDSTTGTAYFLKKTYMSGSNGPGAYWMHAVDVTTGNERANFPVQITGAAQNDPSSSFDATKQLNRSALLLMNGVVYAGFGAMCDIAPYKGWIAGVSTAGQITALWTSVAGPVNGGGIWQSGGGIVSDQPGRMFFATGNGYNSTPNGVHLSTDVQTGSAQSLMRLAVQPDNSLKADNFFSPYDAISLDTWDADLGSAAPTALPSPWFGTPSIPNLMVVAGKQGYIYLLNRDNLGGQQMGSGGSDGVVNRIGPYGGVWSRPAVWPGDGGYIYMPTGSAGSVPGPTGGVLRTYQYGLDGNGNPSLSLAASSSESFGGYSSSAVVTSDGTNSGTGLVWIILVPGASGTNAQLRAYDALPVAGTLNLRFSVPIGTASKFTPPGVGPARIYVGTRDGHLLCYGIPAGSALTAPLTNFGSVTLGQSSAANVTLTASAAVTIQSVTTDNPQFQVGALTTPASLTAGQTLGVPVTFTPTSDTAANGSLRVTTNFGLFEFSLTGTGRDSGPHLQATPAVLSLGGTSVGNTLIGTATLTNSGAQPLTINNVVLPGSPFKAIGAPAAGSQIAPGQSISVNIQFTPAAVGSFTGAFIINSNGGSAQVNLSGSATLPAALTLSTLNLNFGSIATGNAAALSFTVSNTGGSSLQITKSKPPIMGEFTAITGLDEGVIIPAGTSKVISVQFAPTATGSFTDQWVINSDAPTGLQTVVFTGTGVVPKGSVIGGGTSAHSPVNLTTEGPLDWIHWSSAPTDRKAIVQPQLSTYSYIGSGSTFTYANDPRPLNWSDGAVAAASSNNLTGVYTWGVNNGFSFTAPADLRSRTLAVHVGGYYSGGTLVAHLSDGSATDFVDITPAQNGQYDRNYTVTYNAAAPNQTLTVSWVMSSGSGNVTLNAAALGCSGSRAGCLTGLSTATSLPVNLTTEGTLDWIHWANWTFDRKTTATPQIANYSPISGTPIYNYANDPRPIGWTDGAPTLASSNNSNGLYINGTGSGFSLSVPAGTASRVLSLHLGGWNSSGQLQAQLSDGSSVPFVDNTPMIAGSFDRNYVLNFRAASAGQTLTVNWTMTGGTGNVTLNAAALGNAPAQ